jgi:hypothetical protein
MSRLFTYLYTDTYYINELFPGSKIIATIQDTNGSDFVREQLFMCTDVLNLDNLLTTVYILKSIDVRYVNQLAILVDQKSGFIKDTYIYEKGVIYNMQYRHNLTVIDRHAQMSFKLMDNIPNYEEVNIYYHLQC